MGVYKYTLFVISGCMLLSSFLSGVSSLTDDEISEFGARTHIDPNTGLQGFIAIADQDDGTYVVTANGIPDHTAGPFALPPDVDDIIEQDFEFYIPKNPTASDVKYELPMGPVGLALNGVALFNPYAVGGTDAVITEEATFDDCDGHPTPNGIYHYHSKPFCVFNEQEGIASTIIGVALDGFPVYGPFDENGNELYSADLDACHGRYVDGNYRYHVTEDFPYILGCFHGAVDSRNLRPGQVLNTVEPGEVGMTTAGGKASMFVQGSVSLVTMMTISTLSLFLSQFL